MAFYVENQEDNEFKIKWWDLNKNAQRRLLSKIFGTKPIAIANFELEDEPEYICEIGMHGDVDGDDFNAVDCEKCCGDCHHAGSMEKTIDAMAKSLKGGR